MRRSLLFLKRNNVSLGLFRFVLLTYPPIVTLPNYIYISFDIESLERQLDCTRADLKTLILFNRKLEFSVSLPLVIPQLQPFNGSLAFYSSHCFPCPAIHSFITFPHMVAPFVDNKLLPHPELSLRMLSVNRHGLWSV